jgi:hypothetical protein
MRQSERPLYLFLDSLHGPPQRGVSWSPPPV